MEAAAAAVVAYSHGKPPWAALCAAVFFAGGDAAPDMPLRLVDVQHLLDLKVQGAVEMGQTFRDVLMYRGLTDAEFRGGGADRGPVLYDCLLYTSRCV